MRLFYWIIFLILFPTFSVFCDVPDINLVIDPPIAWQGKVLTITLVSPEGIAEVDVSFLDQNFKCYKKGDDWQGVVGVPVNQKTGYYDLDLFITDKNNKKEEISKTLKVWATKFPYSKFWLAPSRDKLRTREIIDDEWAQIEDVLLVEEPVKRWAGRFTLPAEARISQGFGQRQIINGKRSGNHRGVDIAALSGTEVKAPNRGKVVFTKRLKAFGGTLVLDHGQGIHTLYFHLSKIIAKVGAEVEQGEVIALSGNSGISSGAHLHWGMSVHNLRVDPMQWTKYEI